MKTLFLAASYYYEPKDISLRIQKAMDGLKVDFDIAIVEIDQSWSALDFSAYQIGLMRIKNLSDYEMIVFLNDTLFKKYVYKYYIRTMIRKLTGFPVTLSPILVGEIHEFKEIHFYSQLSSSHYVSSFIFGVNRHGINAINDMLLKLESTEIPLQSQSFAELIVSRQKQFQNEETQTIALAKVRAIFYERALSRLFCESGLVIDMHSSKYMKLVRIAQSRLVRLFR